MLKSVAAVAAGYAVMVVLVMGGTIGWVTAMVPGGMKAMRSDPTLMERTPGPRYLAMNLVLSFVAALAGGWVAARIAPGSPAGHLTALALVVVVMGVVSAFAPGAGRQPVWYRLVIPVIGVMGVATSALLTSRPN